MKKLLILLSVLTISGTAVPTTIAASPYQKEETKLENSDINYSKINNLSEISGLNLDSNIIKIDNKIIVNMNVHDENNYNGFFTNDVSTAVTGWKILDYSKFAKSWKDFTDKYKEMIVYGKATTHLWDGNHNTNDSFTIPLKDIPNTNTQLSYDWIKSRVTSGWFSHQDINLFFVVWFSKTNPDFFCFGINKEVSSLFGGERLWYKYDIEKIIFQ